MTPKLDKRAQHTHTIVAEDRDLPEEAARRRNKRGPRDIIMTRAYAERRGKGQSRGEMEQQDSRLPSLPFMRRDKAGL